MVTRRRCAFERGTLWTSDMTGAGVAPVSPRVAIIFSEVRGESPASLAAAMGLSDAETLRRFAGGRRCFAAWDGGRIAAYGWVSRGRECVGELEREFHMPADEAYIWDCVTLPEYRGRRLYSALLGFMLDELRRTGVRRAWIGASLDNRPSIKGFANAGFQPIIKLTYLRLFNLCCSWTTGYPGAPGRLVAAARRMVIADNERAFGPLMIGLSGPAQASESCL